MTDKEKFMKNLEALVDNTKNLKNVADANRRLLAALTTLFIEKEVVTPEEVKKLEDDVSRAMESQAPEKKKRKPRGKKMKPRVGK